ncbi:MAG: GxxExxY protein [Balneolaceae bacterium]|nr:GxxExxY protein [Balneolaceae bacterium]
MLKNTEKYEAIPARLNQIGSVLVDCAFKVHKALGPGLLEKVYEVCLEHELKKQGMQVERQVVLPINYDGLIFEEGLRLDLLVEDSVICELKAVDIVNLVWKAQVLSHLRLTNRRLGYLINFNVKNIGRGTTRIVN